jgi:hypothetical protein
MAVTAGVRGLRREEVALLAGVSVDYYARLEGATFAAYRRGPRRLSPRAPVDEAERNDEQPRTVVLSASDKLLYHRPNRMDV